MRLIRLELENFRQHASTTLEFPEGLTGIIGPNGAGKSTLLEAVGWCLYGAGAARGTNETLRFVKAPGGSRVRAELTLELAGHELRVCRSLTAADVFLDGDPSPVATTIAGVGQYLRRQLGMTREEFFNTYFTGQKELQFLAQLGPTERGRFLNQVLGYERLRLAQDRARTRRSELRHQIEGLRSGLPDPEKLEEEEGGAQAALRAAEAKRAAGDEALTKAEAALAELRPRWKRAQEERDKARDLAHRSEVAGRELAGAERDLARAESELARISQAEGELAPLRERLADLPGLAEECQRLAELARAAERRAVLAEQEQQLSAEREERAARREALEQAPALLEASRAEAESARGKVAEAENRVRAGAEQWAQERQNVQTKLDIYARSYKELKEKLAQLRDAGPEGLCPTCQKPLGESYHRVLQDLQDEQFTLTQDGRWLRQRGDQLADKPKELLEAEAVLERAREDAQRLDARVSRCEAGVKELAQARAEVDALERKLEKTRTSLAGLPDGYDAARHREAERKLVELRSLETRAGGLARLLEARAEREAERTEAGERLERARKAREEAEAARVELAFSEDAFQEARRRFEEAEGSARRAEVAATEARAEERAAAERLEAARRALADYRERRARLGGLELDLRHHNELDAGLSELRSELNDRVRPELSELASAFLADITDGRYTAVELDEGYDILVLDEGEEKPVISGGEEDVANLVLRLAISQMISERVGRPLSILVLDEVFGSLDIQRQDNVVRLLRVLGDRFRQVILITHVEGIREGLDQVIRVDFDERSGASRVSVEPAGRAVMEVAEREEVSA